MARLIFGCGYLGSRVARLWRDGGEQVHAVTRSPERAEALRREGILPLVADVTALASLQDLPPAETVLYAVGHDRAAGKSMREVYVAGLANVLAALPAACGRVIYISSTGVYGDAGGDWVDEETPCNPERENGRICLEAETLLAAHRWGDRCVVLRLAGLYGPGRIPRQATIRAGEPIAAPADGWLNLIHVEDAAAIVLAAERLAVPPARRFVVSDGHPPLRREYYQELARLLGGPAPRFATPSPNSPSAARAAGDKRINNSQMILNLNISLRYPSYRQGLAAILAEEQRNQA